MSGVATRQNNIIVIIIFYQVTIGISNLHGLKVKSDLTDIILTFVYRPLAGPCLGVGRGETWVPGEGIVNDTDAPGD